MKWFSLSTNEISEHSLTLVIPLLHKNYSQMSGLKQQAFIISQFLRVWGLSAAWRTVSAAGLSHACHQWSAGWPAMWSQSSAEGASTFKCSPVVIGGFSSFQVAGVRTTGASPSGSSPAGRLASTIMSKRESQEDEQDTRRGPFLTNLEEVFRSQSQLDLVDTQEESEY